MCDPHPDTKILLDLHDAIPPDWVRPYVGRFHRVMVKSLFHASVCGLSAVPTVTVVPNGVSQVPKAVPRKPVILCTSSPDRCVSALVRALPLVRREVPDAEVWWAYGWREGIAEGGLEADRRPKVREWVRVQREAIAKCEGFRDLGRVSQTEVWDLYRSAKVFGYGTLFPEIDCISMTKAVLSGCIPVVTHVGALGEKLDQLGLPGRPQTALPDGTLDYGLPEGPEFREWVRELCEALRGSSGPPDPSIVRRYQIQEVLGVWMGVLRG
jgi:glycosyltransferase involved in cell wall biosynthesis